MAPAEFLAAAARSRSPRPCTTSATSPSSSAASPAERRFIAAATSPRRALNLQFTVFADDHTVARFERAFTDLDPHPHAGPPTEVRRYELSLDHGNGTGWLQIGEHRYPVTADDVLHKVAQRVKVDAIAASQEALLLHGAAAGRNGHSVILSAEPDAGKSTLVAGLVEAGWTYFTDEVVAIDPATNTIMPFPRPIKFDAGARRLFPAVFPVDAANPSDTPDHIAASRFGTPTQPSPPSVPDTIVVPSYSPDATTQLVPWSRATMMVHLLGQAMSPVDAAQALVLAHVVGSAHTFGLPNSSLIEAVGVLNGHTDTPTELPHATTRPTIRSVADSASEVVGVHFDGDAVLYSPATRVAVAVDEAGWHVWNQLVSGHQVARRDTGFAQHLTERGLVPTGALHG